MKVDTFEAAFRSILGGDDDATARAKIADAQADQFGQKEWTLDAPSRDALGRKIVFKDPSGFRYTVNAVHPDGSHVRTYFDASQPVQSVEVEGRAPTRAAAERLVDDTLISMGETRLVVGGPFEWKGQTWYFVRKKTSVVPLD